MGCCVSSPEESPAKKEVHPAISPRSQSSINPTSIQREEFDKFEEAQTYHRSLYLSQPAISKETKRRASISLNTAPPRNEEGQSKQLAPQDERKDQTSANPAPQRRGSYLASPRTPNTIDRDYNHQAAIDKAMMTLPKSYRPMMRQSGDWVPADAPILKLAAFKGSGQLTPPSPESIDHDSGPPLEFFGSGTPKASHFNKVILSQQWVQQLPQEQMLRDGGEKEEKGLPQPQIPLPVPPSGTPDHQRGPRKQAPKASGPQKSRSRPPLDSQTSKSGSQGALGHDSDEGSPQSVVVKEFERSGRAKMAPSSSPDSKLQEARELRERLSNLTTRPPESQTLHGVGRDVPQAEDIQEEFKNDMKDKGVKYSPRKSPALNKPIPLQIPQTLDEENANPFSSLTPANAKGRGRDQRKLAPSEQNRIDQRSRQEGRETSSRRSSRHRDRRGRERARDPSPGTPGAPMLSQELQNLPGIGTFEDRYESPSGSGTPRNRYNSKFTPNNMAGKKPRGQSLKPSQEPPARF